jgi:AAA family ATPase
LDAIVPGGTFDVVTRRGHLRGPKRRFLVERIEPPLAHVEPSHLLYFYDFQSKVQVMDASSAAVNGRPPPRTFSISDQGVGGLQKQIQLINKRLDALNTDHDRIAVPLKFKRNGSVLLHGPEGTGKSLLLKKLSNAPWHKVFTIDESIFSQYVGQSQTALRKLFGEAFKHQPSLVIIDRLEAIAGKSDRDHSRGAHLASALATELEKIHHTKVVVVAATNCLSDIDKSLRTPSRFRYEIEIPVPDARARTEILKVLQDKSISEPDAVSEIIGERTHGFVGSDLEALYENALERALDRCIYANRRASTEVNGDANHHPDEGASEITRFAHSSQETLVFEVRLEDFEASLLEVRPTAMKEIFLETPKTYWSDIGGSEDVREALYRVTERPFKVSRWPKTIFQNETNAQQRPDLIRDLDLDPQKGILLYGPPGCSKTLTAKAVATEAGLNFIAVKGAELTSMYVGESERAIREVFRKARLASPSVIFFDEIDSIAASRESTSGAQHAASGLNVLTTLLNEMDGIEALKGVLVLAATNKPEILDPALLRPGRFDTLIYIGPPNLEARKQIFQIRTRKMPLAKDVDFDVLAKKTEGYSGAEIVRLCVVAAELTADDCERDDDCGKLIRHDHFQRALQKVVKQITPKTLAKYEGWSIANSNGI